jgi:hypothetical protein
MDQELLRRLQKVDEMSDRLERGLKGLNTVWTEAKEAQKVCSSVCG